MIQSEELRLGNLIEYLIRDTNPSGNYWEDNYVDEHDIAECKNDNAVFNQFYRPKAITLMSLARCNPPQMNKISALLEISMNEQDKSSKEFSIVIKHTGRVIRSVHELQNFYRENTGDDLIYSES